MDSSNSFGEIKLSSHLQLNILAKEQLQELGGGEVTPSVTGICENHPLGPCTKGLNALELLVF